MYLLSVVALSFATPTLAVTAKASSQVDAAKANPIRKILTMLEDMKSELEKEAKDEKDIFEEAMCLCKKGEKELNGVIFTSKGDIDRFTTKVETETALKQQLVSEVGAHKTDLEETTKTLEESAVIREKEAKEFAATDADLKTNLAGLDQAIPLIEQKGEGGASFAQISYEVPNLQKIVASSTYLSVAARSQVTSFLEDKEPSAGVAEILGMLKSMRDEMAKDLKEATDSEEQSVAAYLDMKKNKEAHVKLLMETVLDKEKRTGETTLSLAQSKDSLEDAETELSDATKYLASLQKACADREKNRDARAKMRNDEITAISEAINILSDDDALDAMSKAKGGAASFLQQANRPTVPQINQHASLLDHGSQYIRDLDGARTSFLQLVSSHKMKRTDDSAGSNAEVDPVSENANQAQKVVGYLIDGMVKVLHDDDVEDEHKKFWCFNETETQTQLQEEKTVFQENLAATIDKQNETLYELDADIKVLEKSIYDLDQDVLKASALRKEQHEEFVGTFNAMDTAIRLIDRAELKLNEFYNPKAVEQQKKDALAAAGVEGFLQGPRKMAPVAEVDEFSARRYWDKTVSSFLQTSSTNKLAETAKASSKVDPIVIPETPSVENYEKSESGGVLGLMNKLRTEVKADLKEAEVEEKYAARDYSEEMKEATATRASDAKALTTKKEQQASLAEKQQSDEETNDLTLQELNSIKVYLRELDIECTFIMKNYEARHGARVGEETGLEGAETIVTHEEPPSYEHNEKKFEQEHGHADVDEHFPDKPMPKPQR
eukprot:gnl/MRDRNA2_/MRDRNA2_104900_c0_seq1.p1 gnl/MRDRNA2_/MRDRNA2_104900_c0~~gnl/MRDRNA2_/MRDRNA2_104900_c0_seq1.p1  ORF type:complete len:780 (-),score=233.23 gnl/MRDRNA2_/MRDRNA2_104900_c0_seq1:128-2467(-)